MINLQNKVDKFISSGNAEFAENRNVISALVDYQRALDVYDYMDKYYKIQHHELLVRIAICYDILGNYQRTMDYLTIAMKIVPNICNLVLYKSVLYYANGDHAKGIRLLNKFKTLSVGLGKENLFELFRLVFNYVEGGSKKKLIEELTIMLNDKTKRYALAYYLKAIIYLEIDKEKKEQNANNASSNNSELTLDYKNTEEYKQYEKNLKLAEDTDPADTDFLIKDGISSENLTKIFFMILPEMDDYQPKALANYNTFNIGISVIFTLYRSISCFKLCSIRNKLSINKENHKEILQSFSGTNTETTQNSSSSNLVYNKSILSQSKSITNNKMALFTKPKPDSSLEKSIKTILSKSIFTYIFSIKDNISLIFLNLKEKNKNSAKIKSDFSNNQNNKNINFANEEHLTTNYFIKNSYYSPYNIKNIYLKYLNSKCNTETKREIPEVQAQDDFIDVDISKVSQEQTLNNEESLILSFFKEKNNKNKQKTLIDETQENLITNKNNYKTLNNNDYNKIVLSDSSTRKRININTKLKLSTNALLSSNNNILLTKNKEFTLNKNSLSKATKLAQTTSDYLYSDPGNPVINLKKKFTFRESNNNMKSDGKLNKNLTLTENDRLFNSPNKPYYRPNEVQSIKFSTNQKNYKSNGKSINSAYLDNKLENLISKEQILLEQRKISNFAMAASPSGLNTKTNNYLENIDSRKIVPSHSLGNHNKFNFNSGLIGKSSGINSIKHVGAISNKPKQDNILFGGFNKSKGKTLTVSSYK